MNLRISDGERFREERREGRAQGGRGKGEKSEFGCASEIEEAPKQIYRASTMNIPESERLPAERKRKGGLKLIFLASFIRSSAIGRGGRLGAFAGAMQLANLSVHAQQ